MKNTIKKLIASCVLATTSSAFCLSAYSDTIWVGWPSPDKTDERFISMSGTQTNTEYNDIVIKIGIPISATSFDLEFFDGDASGIGLPGFDPDSRYDSHFNAAAYSYTLYEDQNQTGNTTNTIQVKTDADFVNNEWSTFLVGQTASHGVAVNPGDEFYYYRLVLSYTGDTENDIFLNGLKVRVRSDGDSLPELSILDKISVVASPINQFNDPDPTTSGYPYDGSWSFPVRVGSGFNAPLLFTDIDADHKTDNSSPDSTNTIIPGDPADDFSGTASIPKEARLISPNIRYTIFDPSGNLLLSNNDPSGDAPDEETFSYAAAGGAVPEGIYRWNWIGVDAGNTIILETNGELLPPCVCRY